MFGRKRMFGAPVSSHSPKTFKSIIMFPSGALLSSHKDIQDSSTIIISKHYRHNQDNEVGDVIPEKPLPVGSRNYVCCVCGKQCALLDDLIKHYNIHNEELHCHFCRATFSRVISLASHLNDAHPECQLFCQRCCITFNNMWQMNEHMGKHLKKDIAEETSVDPKRENGITQNCEVQINCLKEKEEIDNVPISSVKEEQDDPVNENVICEVRCVKKEDEEVQMNMQVEEVEINFKEEEEEVVIDKVFERCVKDEEKEIMIQNVVELNVLKEEEGGVSIAKTEEIEVNMVTKEEYDITQICVFNNQDFESISDQQEFDLGVQEVLLDHNYACSQSHANPIAVPNQYTYNTHGSMESDVKDRPEHFDTFHKKTKNGLDHGVQSDMQITKCDHRVHLILHDHDYLMTQSPLNPIVSERTHVYNTRSSVRNTTKNALHHFQNKDQIKNTAKWLHDHNYLSDNVLENLPIKEKTEENEDNESLSSDHTSCSLSPDDSDYIPSKFLDSLSSSSCSLPDLDSDDRDSKEDSESLLEKSIITQRQGAKQDSTSSVKRGADPVVKNFQICPRCGLSKDLNPEKGTNQCTCERSNKCSLCEGTFTTLELLLKHQADKHPKARYFCMSCQQLFLNLEAFSKHTCSKAMTLTSSVSVNHASPSILNPESSYPPFKNQVPQKSPTVFSHSPKILHISGLQNFPVQVMTTKSLRYNQNQMVTCLLLNGGQALVTPSSATAHTHMGQIPVLIPVRNNAVPNSPVHSVSSPLQSVKIPLPRPASSQIFTPQIISAQTGYLFQSNTSNSYAPIQGLRPNQITLKPLYGKRSQKMSFHKRLRENWLSKAKFPCRQCGVTSSQPSVSVQHRYQHRGLRIHRCQCGRAFQHRLHLLRHQVHHAETSVYVCAKCGRTFHGTRHLARHRPDTSNRLTNGRKKAKKDCTNVFHCHCGLMFGRPSALLWHMLKNVKVH